MLPFLASMFGGSGAASAVGSMIPGVLGTLAGAFGTQSKKSMELAGPSATGQAGEQAILQNLGQLQNYANLGPGAQDVTGGVNAQRSLADMLQSFSKGGFLPGQEDWNTANQFASQAFQPQQVAMNQAFQQNQQRTAQLAAQLGRPVNDPILQAKLAQEQMQGAERLGASQSAYASEFAQRLPQQRLGYMGQFADVKSGLASQAMANRQALIGIGSNLQQQDQNFRLQSAGVNVQQGGGKQGEIAGFLAGGGKGIGQMFANSLFGNNETTNTNGTGFDPFGPNTPSSQSRSNNVRTMVPGQAPNYNNYPQFNMQGPTSFPSFGNWGTQGIDPAYNISGPAQQQQQPGMFSDAWIKNLFQ